MTKTNFGSLSRRAFSAGVLSIGAAGLLGPGARLASAEPPPETTRLRLTLHRPACWAPQYVAEEMLRAEGFTEIEYVKAPGGKILDRLMKAGQIDLTPGFSGRQIKGVVPGDPSVFLAGLHAGCYSVIASDRIRSIRDLRGKTVWVADAPQSGPHVFFSAIAAYVGLDPVKDINYLWISKRESIEAFTEGRIDAFMSFAPEPQELRARNVGHVLVDTNVDRPWSQYFCCMIVGNRDFVAKNPIATKRALRAILRANDICSREPERAATALIEKGARTPAEYEFVLQGIREIPYGKWRDSDPEDTVRYYALRLRELGMIQSTPQEIIARNTDWRFLRELKDELDIRL